MAIPCIVALKSSYTTEQMIMPAVQQALIELARMLKSSKIKKYNYLFIAFSGEELGLFGSKYYTEHPTVDLSQVNFMINMDMIGG
jgi:Zn-dependent M28 family amino/carboxypeptidase